MNFNNIMRYFFISAYKPRQTINKLFADKHKIAYSLSIFLFLGVIYTITVVIAYNNGYGANVEPFIKIPAEDYYFWQAFYQAPLFIVIAVIFAGTVRLMAMPFGGRGSFEDSFAICCTALTFPMFLTMWIPESIVLMTSLGPSTFPAWFDYSRQIIGVLWPIVIMVLGVSKAEQIHWGKAIAAVAVASIPLTAFMVIFIR